MDNGFPIAPLAFTENLVRASQGYNSLSSKKNHEFQSKKILLIPLDSRPVNTTYVSLLGGIANFHVIYPQTGLDYYTKPCDYPLIEKFLMDNIQSVDAVIIGIPQWLNGGIIEARNPQSYLKNQERIQKLKEILSRYPDKKIYLINLIPREIPSYTLNSFQHRAEIITFGKIYDEFCTTKLNNKDKLWIKLKNMEQSNPTSYIAEYITLFEENYKVTKELMDWVQIGIADELLIGMDDTSSKGMTKVTERKIQDYLKKKQINNVTVMAGADELSSLILARYKNELSKTGSNYSLTYSRSSDKNRIFPYDGRSLAVVVQEKMNYVQPANHTNEIPLHLYIHSSEESIASVKEWANSHKTGMKGVANLAFAYTHISWMEDYFNHKLDQNIESFCGWNTSANTIGLLIAHMEMIKDVPTWNTNHSQWMILRYLEDYYYNLIKRKEYSQTYSPFYTLNPGEKQALTSTLCNEGNKLLDHLSIINSQDGERVCYPAQLDIAQMDLPWNRIYEISCILKAQKETD